MASNAILFEKAAEVGEEDILSHLPYDCLLSVLHYADRDSLDLMEGVSQMMHSVSRRNGYIKPRKIVDEFILETKNRGVTIYINANDSCKVCKVYLCGRVVKTQQDEARVVPPKISGCDHVPPKLFDVMTELCAKYAPRKLNLSKIYFNGDFARKLEDALNGSMPNHLELTGCGFRDMQLVSDFFFTNEITRLQIFSRSVQLHGIFTEEFIRDFSLVGTGKHELSLNRLSEHRWMASGSVLPYICRYSMLHLPAMVLTIELLDELISLAHESAPVDAVWMFSMDAIIDKNHLVLQFDRELFLADASDEFDNENRTVAIMQLSNLRRCKITTPPSKFDTYYVKIEFSKAFDNSD